MFNSRYLEYSKEKFIITLKSFKEYKTNFYTLLFSDIVSFVIFIFFYLFYLNILDDQILDWTIFDFVVFLMLIRFSIKLRNCFYFWSFPSYILRGGFNSLLSKPISPYFKMMLNAWQSGRVVTMILTLIINIFIFVFFSYSNYFLALVFWIVGFVANLFFYNAIEIFKFFIIKDFGIKELSRSSHTIVRVYTFAPFQSNNFISSVILLLVPIAFVSFVTFEILRGNIGYFYKYFISILILAIFMILINIYLWRAGLQKYEAYG